VNPLGPIHANVNGPGVPEGVMSIEPLKGALQLVFPTTVWDNVMVGAVLGTVNVKIPAQPNTWSVIVTV